MELYLKLRELGHPHYLTRTKVFVMPCSKHKQDVDLLLQKMQEYVSTWKIEVSQLRDSYPFLLYFSVPKILQLFELLYMPPSAEESYSEEIIENIIQEVSPLTIYHPSERMKLKNGIKVAFCQKMHNIIM